MKTPTLLRILIVDDNRIIRHLLRLTFSDQQRFLVHEADSSQQLLVRLEQFTPDVIILDVMLPGGRDGFDLCRDIKSRTDLSHCKVILLSARSQQEDLAMGEQAGADLYITKPFSPEKLIHAVESLLKPI